MNINGKWYTEPQTIAYVNEMEAKISELEAKHWNECTIISQYEAENRLLKEQICEEG